MQERLIGGDHCTNTLFAYVFCEGVLQLDLGKHCLSGPLNAGCRNLKFF